MPAEGSRRKGPARSLHLIEPPPCFPSWRAEATPGQLAVTGRSPSTRSGDSLSVRPFISTETSLFFAPRKAWPTTQGSLEEITMASHRRSSSFGGQAADLLEDLGVAPRAKTGQVRTRCFPASRSAGPHLPPRLESVDFAVLCQLIRRVGLLCGGPVHFVPGLVAHEGSELVHQLAGCSAALRLRVSSLRSSAPLAFLPTVGYPSAVGFK